MDKVIFSPFLVSNLYAALKIHKTMYDIHPASGLSDILYAYYKPYSAHTDHQKIFPNALDDFGS
jgi:hypothetical protein